MNLKIVDVDCDTDAYLWRWPHDDLMCSYNMTLAKIAYECLIRLQGKFTTTRNQWTSWHCLLDRWPLPWVLCLEPVDDLGNSDTHVLDFPCDVNKDFNHKNTGKDLTDKDKDKDRDLIYTAIKDQQVDNIKNQGQIYSVATRITCSG